MVGLDGGSGPRKPLHDMVPPQCFVFVNLLDMEQIQVFVDIGRPVAAVKTRLPRHCDASDQRFTQA